MLPLLALLLACSPGNQAIAAEGLPDSFAGAADQASVAPSAPWFYADLGRGIDWDSLQLVGRDVAFRTDGGDLGSGPIAAGESLAGTLACGTPTRLTVALRDGKVDEVWTMPRARCVEARVGTIPWETVDLGAVRAEDTAHALVILDVPTRSTVLASVSP